MSSKAMNSLIIESKLDLAGGIQPAVTDAFFI